MGDVTYTLEATDSANEATANVTITVGGSGCEGEGIEATFIGLGGSPFLILPGLVTIKSNGTDFSFFSRVFYDPPAFIGLGKLVNPLGPTILQPVIVLPGIVAGIEYPATVEVKVNTGTTDVFDTMEVPAAFSR